MLKQSLYSYGVYTLKNYRHFYKLTLYKCLRNSGVEDNRKKNFSAKNTINTTKLDNNISRAKSTILQYALCNDFDYFVTLTISEKKYKRNDLKTFYNDFGNWLREYKRYYKIDKINYIFIPELHKDKENWHIHGLISGIKSEHLTLFNMQEHPKKLWSKHYLNFEKYQNKFGFCSFGILDNKEKASYYIIKYITKDLAYTQTTLNHRLYYCSRGLEKAVTVKKGNMYFNINENQWHFKNDYIKTMTIKNEHAILLQNYFVEQYTQNPQITAQRLNNKRKEKYINTINQKQ